MPMTDWHPHLGIRPCFGIRRHRPWETTSRCTHRANHDLNRRRAPSAHHLE
jgi:hypothetical protein